MDDEITPTDGLDRDTFHTLLSNPRRRAMIRHLDRHGSLDKGELATLVAADEVGKDPNDLESEERKRVMIAIQQQHIDSLTDAGVIEMERDIIRQAENFPQLANGLHAVEGAESQSINITIESATINIEGEFSGSVD